MAPLPPTVIAFDNLHRITNPHLVAELGRFIERAPRQVHCVIATRVDPPMPLSRFRLHGDLLELRRHDLAFTLDEATTLLERLTGKALPRDHVRVLWERTEGWAAGLQLAGLNLRQHDDADAFVADFGGSDRLVADYLGQEVLASLSPDRRRVLLQLSALDDMCAGLVQATTGYERAQSLLHALERESMFLVPLDSRGEWFRFHHLFRELLRSRLRDDSPAEELKLITAAADWNLTRGRVKPAMEYLLRAQARDGALEAMLAAVPEVVTGAVTRAEVLTGVRQVLADEPAEAAAGAGAFAEASAAPDVAADVPAAPAAAPDRWNTRTRPGLGYVAAQVLWRARPEASPETARRRLLDVEARCARTPSHRLTRQDAAEEHFFH